jgi:hypothetical protein
MMPDVGRHMFVMRKSRGERWIVGVREVVIPKQPFAALIYLITLNPQYAGCTRRAFTNPWS